MLGGGGYHQWILIPLYSSRHGDIIRFEVPNHYHCLECLQIWTSHPLLVIEVHFKFLVELCLNQPDELHCHVRLADGLGP